MRLITIVVKEYGMMTVCEGKEPHATLQWQAPGLDIYTKGPIAKWYDQACHMANTAALDMHIPLISLHTVNRNRTKKQDLPRISEFTGVSLRKRLF